MDDNVAKAYATRATEAGHYIQYDQGESSPSYYISPDKLTLRLLYCFKVLIYQF